MNTKLGQTLSNSFRCKRNLSIEANVSLLLINEQVLIHSRWIILVIRPKWIDNVSNIRWLLLLCRETVLSAGKEFVTNGKVWTSMEKISTPFTLVFPQLPKIHNELYDVLFSRKPWHTIDDRDTTASIVNLTECDVMWLMKNDINYASVFKNNTC